jgi:DNA ligase-1
MNEFANLIHELSETKSLIEKSTLINEYFSKADDQDKLRALSLLIGVKPKRTIRTNQLKEWCIENTGIEEWLFQECYQMVGDLAETITLLTSNHFQNINELNANKQSLSNILDELESLSRADDSQKKLYIIQMWKQLNTQERFVFNKLITGGFRVGVSANIVSRALAQLLNQSLSEIQHKLSGKWTHQTTSWEQLLMSKVSDLSKPYPFFLCHAVDENINEFSPNEWYAENKWDGIRGQIIKRENEIFIWSRGEELMTDQFPELAALKENMPDGTVLDGEIICMVKTEQSIYPLPFNLLQKRIGRKKPGKQLLQEVPVMFIAYDILEWERKDIRQEPLKKRRHILDSFFQTFNANKIVISPLLEFENKQDLKSIRDKARKEKAEGIMLKRKDSLYLSGRKKGDWWKWKSDPFSIDCVLLYAQAGHGRRSGLYTDYTFAVRDGERLVTFTKAYSGLTDIEIKEVDAFIKKNAVEKFGPVRTVKPELVFEIAFEGIQESKRHKSGVALRFPRISRWRKDKTVDEINTLDDLKALLNQTD